MSKPDPVPGITDPSWLGQGAASTSVVKLSGVTAPDSVMSQQTRELLGNEFDQQIAGTGGITDVTAERMQNGDLRVSITGTVGDSLARSTASADPGEQVAPNFNSSSKLMRAGELGLSHHEWERAHLWGPGFGDEAAAGVWYAREEVNQALQNRVVEGFIRDIATDAEARGGRVELTVTGQRWSAADLESDVPGEERLKQGEFLKAIRYDLTITDADGDTHNRRLEFSVAKPPDGMPYDFECDEATKPFMEDLRKQFRD